MTNAVLAANHTERCDQAVHHQLRRLGQLSLRRNLRVFEEDRLMVESQQPESLPLDFGPEAHIPADRSSMAYRGGLKRMGFGPFFLV